MKPMFGDRLYQVSAPHFCAGVTETYDGIISFAAPILRWTIDKRMSWFKQYCARKGWRVIPVIVTPEEKQ